MAGRGLIVTYRWTVEAAQESVFTSHWQQLTRRLLEFGGLGSCLSRNAEGEFVALAAWPDEETRSAAFAQLEPLPPLNGVVRLSAEVLHVTDDLWIRSPFKPQS